MNILQNTYLLPVNGKYLVYSPFASTRALVNKSAALEIKKGMKAGAAFSDNQGQVENLLIHLNEKKVLPEKRKGEINPLFLGIIPTRSCNGACNYCDFGADKAPDLYMPLKRAVSAVDWYSGIVRKNKHKLLEIHFFGGEPMMAMDVVETVVHRARFNAQNANLKTVFEISTNGQYHRDKAEFLGSYFTTVILSLDGFEPVQNAHRPLKNGRGSFQDARRTAEIISGSSARLGLRACVSDKNVDQMGKIAEWFCREFKPFSINFEALRETSETSIKNLYPPDPVKFAVSLIKARRICASYGIPLVYATDISMNPVYSSCPVGKDTAIVSPDGRISNCYLMPEKWKEIGMDLDFGFIRDDNVVVIEKGNLKTIRNDITKKPRCSRCFCRWSCAGGCHVGNTFPGAGNDYNDYCRQTRMISLSTLLDSLGMDEMTNEILEETARLESFANQSSDLLMDFM